MNDEHNKTVLVEQDKALEFYFDSLLLSEDVFIEEQNEPQIIDQPPSIQQHADAALNSSAVGVAEKKNLFQKVITEGPVSPKPRQSELIKPCRVEPVSGNIIVSEKDKDGQLLEQVLIPRSQRLAVKKPHQTLAKKLNLVDSPEHETSIQTLVKQLSDKQYAASILQKNIAVQEAPKLDLSLFLPKIKTLSDEEISQQEMANALAAQVPNAPAWAESGFQALLFSISGLKLAVPLNELHGILEWGDEYISELAGHASWYLGLIRNQGVNVPVVDTLQQVVPENRWPKNYLKERKFKHIILIDNSHWGLACESVVEVINLKAESVKWRSSRTKRRWLLGTVIDHMCALLDTDEFASMLKTSEDSI